VVAVSTNHYVVEIASATKKPVTTVLAVCTDHFFVEIGSTTKKPTSQLNTVWYFADQLPLVIKTVRADYRIKTIGADDRVKSVRVDQRIKTVSG
jgi:hypothetical protein